MSNQEIPQTVVECGAMAVRIFAILLTHESMTEQTIAEKANIKVKSVSPAMTLLRRTGWVESNGKRGDLRWTRRAEYAEPQPDFYQRQRESTLQHHIKEARRHLKIIEEKAGKLAALEKAFKNVDLAEYFGEGSEGNDTE